MGFIIGLLVGGTVGAFAIALCISSGQADTYDKLKDNDKDDPRSK